jgi:hypothetical protein
MFLRAKFDSFRATFDSVAPPEMADALARPDLEMATLDAAAPACCALPDLNQSEESADHDLRRDGCVAIPWSMPTASADLNLARSRLRWRLRAHGGRPVILYFI